MNTEKQNLLTNEQVKEVNAMNTELQILLEKGFIETKEDAELYLNNKALAISYECEGESVEDNIVLLFNTIDYLAKVTGKVLEDEKSGERKLDILNQPVIFLGPDGEAYTYKQLLRMKEIDDEFADIKQRTKKMIYDLILDGRINTKIEAVVFMINADSIYSKNGSLKENVEDNVSRIYLSEDELFYCEFEGRQTWDEKDEVFKYDFMPGDIRYYGPDGEESSYEELHEKMLEYERRLTV